MSYRSSPHFHPSVPARPARGEGHAGDTLRIVDSSGQTLYIVHSSEFHAQSPLSGAVFRNVTFQSAPTVGYAETEIASYDTATGNAYTKLMPVIRHGNERFDPRSNPHDAVDLRDSLRNLLDLLSDPVNERPSAFRNKRIAEKKAEKALHSLDDIVKTLVEQNLELASAARESVVPAPLQTAPAHAAGYDAAIAAGADTRARLFKAMASSEDFASHAGISRETVNTQRKAGRLLALTNGTRYFRYPLWQLEPAIKPSMEAILRELHSLDPWTIYLFLTQGSPLLTGQSPLESLRSARADDVLDAARSYAAELA
jgi:hypothetical protein